MLLWTWAALATSYVYDSSGRLVAVTNDADQSARYVYDKMGNLTRVDRFAAGELAILGFGPGRGAPGAAVKIVGRGFSATPAQNSVKFNGTAAVVATASPTELVATVPAGATTGPVSITVGAASDTSGSDFVVDANAHAPVISAIAPRVVAAGTAVTIDGQHLAPVDGQTSVRLNRRPAVPNAIADAQIVFAVPTNAGSGKVSVTTPYGTAYSVDDVVFAPGGVDPANVVQVERLAADAAAQGFSIANRTQSAAVLFDGVAGEYLSAQFSAINAARVEYALYGVDNKRLVYGAASLSEPSFHLPRLKQSGTYLLLMNATTDAASWSVAIERAKALPVDGASLELDTTVAGQSKRLTFNAAAGANFGFGIADRATPASWGAATVYAYGPEGEQIGYQYCDQAKNGCGLNLSKLKAGTHTLVVIPSSSGTRLLGFAATLSSDAAGALTRDAASTLNIARRGQNARWTFTGTAGEALGLQVGGQVTVPAARNVYYRINAPDGTLWKSAMTAAGMTMSLSLPATGTYEVVVDPEYGETATAQWLLSTGTAGGTQLDGTSGEFATTLPGQGVYLTFAATAGQNLGLGISDLNLSSGESVGLNVYKPDGTPLANTTCFAANGGCDLNLPNMAAGTYGVDVLPSAGDQTMSFKTTLSSDATGTLTRSVQNPLAIARRGQNARLSFTGTIGETVALKVTAQTTTPANGRVYYRVYAPDGSSVASASAIGEKTLHVDLPVSGDYRVFIDPEYGATVNASIEPAAAVVGSMELDGSSGKYQTAAGQQVTFTIDADAGKHLGFALSNLTVNSGSSVRIYAYAPNGDSLSQDSYCNVDRGGCDIDLFNPVDGNYSIVVSPTSSSQTMQFRSSLSSSVAAALPRNVPLSLNLDRRGQDGMMTFTGTAGETIGLQVAGQGTAPSGNNVRYRIYKPSDRRGSYPWKELNTVAGDVLNMSLPESGTYWVWVDPGYGAATSAQLTLSTGTTSSMVLDGADASFRSMQPGQTAYYRINAVAGQGLGFAVSDLTVSSGGSVRIYAYAPNGDSVSQESTYCNVSSGGCDVDIYSPISGTYAVAVVPGSDTQIMQFKASLSSNAGGALTRDVPTMLRLDRRGQDGLMTFTGTAGETLSLQVAGQATTPAGFNGRYRVYKPTDRRQSYPWKDFSTVTGDVLNMSLTETGTYWVWVDPAYGASTNAQITLSTGTTSGMVLDGASASIETAQPGQTAYFRFNAIAGQSQGFAVSDLVVSSGSSVRIYAYAPNGESVPQESTYCNVDNGGCDVDIFSPVSGTYSVAVVPTSEDQAMQFKATLSSNVTGALSRDVATALSLDRRGRDGLLTFTGTAGETIALQVQGQATVPAGNSARYRVYRPNDRRQSYPWKDFSTASGGVLNMSLTETGTYWVWIDPAYGASTNAQLTLSTGTTSGMVLDGASASFASTQAGQNAYYRFSASAGQNLGFGLSDLAVNSGSSVRIYAYAPNGESVAQDSTYCNVDNGGCDVNIYNAVAGTYSVVVVPSSDSQTMQFKATLSTNVTGALSRDVATALSLDRRGRDGLLTFTGTAGETIALQVQGQATVPAGNSARYRVYTPNDRRQSYPWKDFSTASGGVLNMSLTETGTYWVWIDPAYGASTNAQLTLSTGTTSGMVLDGASANFASTQAGQNAYYRFSASAGQNLGFGLSDLTVNSGSSVRIYAYAPNGESVAQDSTYCNVDNGGCDVDIYNAVAGTYSVVVVPSSDSQTMQFKATLSSSAAATLARDVATPVAMNRRGRDGMATFTGASGEALVLRITGQATTPAGYNVRYRVYRPNERRASYPWKEVTTSSGSAISMSLPEAGTYWIWADPGAGAEASVDFTLDSTP